MEEQPNSWVRRASFSHTIYHRLDSSTFQSAPLTKLPPLPSTLRLKRELSCSSIESSTCNYRSEPLQKFPVSKQRSLSPLPETILPETFKDAVNEQKNSKKFPVSKQRSLSPLPQTILPETFKEARRERLRSTIPNPQKKTYDKRSCGNLFHKDPTGALKHLSSMKSLRKSKTRKDSTWVKYFDYGSGRVTALDVADEWEVDMSELYLGSKFAKGAHSQLYHGIYKDQSVAVKIIRQPDDDENGTMAARLEKQFNREVTLLSHLEHPNVIKLVAACKEPPVFCVITEYLSGGSLRAFLHKLEFDHESLPLDKLIAIALDIARGMEYIHSQGVIHRDLKPENIILDHDSHLKVVDFGIACGEAYCDPLAEDPGTYRWMAPEMIKHKHYSRKVDVYSFGLVLWEMLAGKIPYVDMTPVQAAFAVVHKNLRPTIPTGCPTALGTLIEQCWTSRSEKRPEFWQIVKVLEEFESSVAHDGTLNLAQNLTCHDHKKGLRYWIQKHSPVSPDHPCMPVPKPKFA